MSFVEYNYLQQLHSGFSVYIQQSGISNCSMRVEL